MSGEAAAALTVGLVAAVTNPAWECSRDDHEQYREHVIASLRASPWARVIKASDFTDNAVGIIHTTGPKLSRLASKYDPLVSRLRELILRPDTPLEGDARDMIAAQLDAARERFAAIGHDNHGDSRQAPALAVLVAIRAPVTTGRGRHQTGTRAWPLRRRRRRSLPQLQVPDDGDDLAGHGGTTYIARSAKSMRDSLWACLSIGQFHRGAG